MRYTLALAAVVVGLSAGTVAQAETREQAIRAASRLSKVSYDKARYARFRGKQGLAQAFRQMSNMADDAERMARFSSRQATAQKVNQIINLYLNLRSSINALGPFDRMVIKRDIRNGINRLGDSVFTNFVQVYKMVDGTVMSEEQQLDTVSAGSCDSDWSTSTNSIPDDGDDLDLGGFGGGSDDFEGGGFGGGSGGDDGWN